MTTAVLRGEEVRDGGSGAGGWKMAASPLVTRWAKDVSPKNSLPEYPRPQLVRKEWVNLNGLWQFAAVKDLADAPVGKDLDGKILVPFCMESALSGVGKHSVHTWYRRMFSIPQTWKGKRILLHFGAVDYESTVMVNGKTVGNHRGGYDGFSFDLTDALKTEGEQELVVGVTDTTDAKQARGKQTNDPKGIFYTPCSGIWQTVWMEPVNELHIEGLKIVPDVDGGVVKITASGPNAIVKTGPVLFTVLDGAKEVATGQGGVGEEVTIKIPDAKLWSPGSPFLYDLRVQRVDDSANNRVVLDELSSYFGMRKIEVGDVGGVRRVKLNGNETMMIGPLDQGFWPDGIYSAPTDAALKYDLEMTKKLGFNCLRKHVKIEPQRFYYWCDKLGIMVWQDMPSTFLAKADESAQKQFEAELQAMIQQHFNAPSIVMWVPINEGWGQGAYGKDGTNHLVAMIKELDPTRLVNNSSGWTDSGGGDVHDIHAYPGPAAPKMEADRVIVLGEFGGLGLGVDGHTWSAKAWGYQGMASQSELTEKYVRLLGRLWELHDNQGLCAGIYTQTTDVETECNGLLTYDREILKVDLEKVRDANLGKGPRFTVAPVVATAQTAPSEWRYTTEKPNAGWEASEFDDAKWSKGKSGFGTEGTPGAIVNTKWDTADIWMRREIELPEVNASDLRIEVHHDEDCEIYINGVLANKARNFVSDYVERAISADAMKTIKAGKNTIAVHCHQTTGGQYIDVGLVRMTEKSGQASVK